jgi:P-type conjugative transfer protein TrbJ
MSMRLPSTRHLVTAALASAAAAAMLAGFVLPASPAQAIPVFDASNYTQNLLTAARTLEQINNQIRSLQNEATMLLNQAKNLTRIDFPQLEQLKQALQQVDRLMGQAQGIEFRVDGLDDRFRTLFPGVSGPALGTGDQVTRAKARLDIAMAALHQTMAVQAQVVENVQTDAQALDAAIARSQDAEGALQATQATNQLLALAAKQQFQIQNLMAAQYRAEAMDSARRAQAEADARASTRKFLGSGTAYTPR